MNKWIAMGRPTKDPEVRYTKDNKAIATINLAVDRRFNRDVTDFFKCTAFGKTAKADNLDSAKALNRKHIAFFKSCLLTYCIFLKTMNLY